MKPGPKPLESKICPLCGIEKPRSEFYKKLSTISHKCKQCSLADNRTRAKKYIGKYSSYQNDWRKARYSSDKQYRERIAQQKKTIYDKRNMEINAARRLRWANDPNNPAKLYYRRKDVKNKTPKCVSMSELLAVYANCPKGMEVDHIVPLRGVIDGRPVTGLHVPWNLQYLTPTQNRQKKNRITESDL